MEKISLFSANKLIDEYEKMRPKDRIQLHKKRLFHVVSYAKENSPYYSELYQNLPINFSINDIPVTNRDVLTEDYSKWSTDPEVTIDGIRKHLEDHPDNEELYLGKYFVLSTSGVDDEPLFSLYDHNMCNLLCTLSMKRGFARKEHFWLSAKNGGRIANIYSTNGAFFPNVFANIQKKTLPFREKKSIILQAQGPLAPMVNTLNEFNPALLSGYPSALNRLADEKKAGRLRIKPVCIMANGEELSLEVRTKLARIFDCDITSSYTSVEGGVIAYECREHHLHLNDDWVIIEPVDYDNNPVQAGEECDHVLITNLMNYTMPVIRYPLNDKLRIHTAPCLCGNNSPWVEILGRSLDQVVFNDGAKETLVPISEFEEVLKNIEEIKRYQILVYPNNYLSLRIAPNKGYDKTLCFFKAEKVLRDYLKTIGVVSSAITLEKDAPKADPLSGKYATIITM